MQKEIAQAHTLVVRMGLVAQRFVCAMDDANPFDIIFSGLEITQIFSPVKVTGQVKIWPVINKS